MCEEVDVRFAGLESSSRKVMLETFVQEEQQKV